eukprot:TRINITY_DN6682_c0_g1_i2.p1 TRINITY_DN6682_c0_g1~~TRINITY_DN6682_c0_g1_i2.p1  ORF type:complete len:255 (-),score=93.62 TRINITY_DN6682_c0_g1_i2:182-901(-)
MGCQSAKAAYVEVPVPVPVAQKLEDMTLLTQLPSLTVVPKNDAKVKTQLVKAQAAPKKEAALKKEAAPRKEVVAAKASPQQDPKEKSHSAEDAAAARQAQLKKVIKDDGKRGDLKGATESMKAAGAATIAKAPQKEDRKDRKDKKQPEKSDEKPPSAEDAAAARKVQLKKVTKDGKRGAEIKGAAESMKAMKADDEVPVTRADLGMFALNADLRKDVRYARCLNIAAMPGARDEEEEEM